MASSEPKKTATSFDFQSALKMLGRDNDWSRSDAQLGEIFRLRAAALAKRTDAGHKERGTAHIRFVVHGATFGVELKQVRTITVPSWVTSVPGVPEHLSRVFQVNGRIVSLVDLGALLGLPKKSSDRQKAVLLEHKSSLLGVLAHRILGIVSIDARELSPSAATNRGGEFVSGITSDMTLVLDPARLLGELRFESTQTG